MSSLTRVGKVRLLRLIALLTGMVLLYAALRVGGYFLAMHEDRECFSSRDVSRARIEDCLFLYVTSDCERAERLIGFEYDAGICVKYEILGLEPIHAIFDERGKLLDRVSAYE